MVTDMKATIDLADDLFLRAKELSKALGVPLRELMSEGLAYAIENRSTAATFHVKPVTFKGKGLAPEFKLATWGAIRDAGYEGHGVRRFRSADRDFSRFPSLKVENPLVG